MKGCSSYVGVYLPSPLASFSLRTVVFLSPHFPQCFPPSLSPFFPPFLLLSTFWLEIETFRAWGIQVTYLSHINTMFYTHYGRKVCFKRNHALQARFRCQGAPPRVAFWGRGQGGRGGDGVEAPGLCQGAGQSEECWWWKWTDAAVFFRGERVLPEPSLKKRVHGLRP